MMLRPKERKPDYRQLLKVLHKETADRPVLFELFVCDGILEQVTETSLAGKSRFDRDCLTVQAYDLLGYDYGLVMASEMKFLSGKLNAKASYSLNDGAVIHDRNTFDRYPWPDAADYDYSYLDTLKEQMPAGMGLLVWANDGPLESVIRLVGYENLCYMLYDDEALLADIFEQVGECIYEDYRHAMAKSSVAGLVVGDDWGFNTQTMLPVDIYRKYLFPWHKKIVALAHETGRARGLLLQTMARGGYALGSGNSIPAYIPVPNYYAMLKAAYSPDQ